MTLPLLVPAVRRGAVLVFLLAINNFVIPDILGPVGKPTVAQIVYEDAVQFGQFAAAITAAMSMFAATALLLLAFGMGRKSWHGELPGVAV